MCIRDRNTIYVEYSDVENESETVKNNLADTILKLIENLSLIHI